MIKYMEKRDIILIVMATSLDMGRAVSDVYLNGISISVIAFAILIWWILGDGEGVPSGADEEKKDGEGKKKAKEEDTGGKGGKKSADGSDKEGEKEKVAGDGEANPEDLALPRRKTYSKIGDPYRRIKKEEIEEEEPEETLYGGEEY